MLEGDGMKTNESETKVMAAGEDSVETRSDKARSGKKGTLEANIRDSVDKTTKLRYGNKKFVIGKKQFQKQTKTV